MKGKQIKTLLTDNYLMLARGEGIYLYDSDGKAYLDGASGVGVTSLGYGNKEIIAALTAQAETLPFSHGLRFNNPALQALAERVADFTPEGLTWSYFTCGGSEAVESVLKLCRQYHIEKGNILKHKIIGRWQSFHGNTLATQSMGGHIGRRARHTPLLFGWTHIPPPNCYRCWYENEYPHCNVLCARELERAILQENPETVAAFIAEPFVGAASGAVSGPPAYFKIVREICDKYDILFIVDEIVDGFGRTGLNFGIDHFGVTPDVMTIGKSISAGYAPLGGVIVHERIVDVFLNGSKKFEHNYTFAGNPLSCAVGNKTLEIYMRDRVFENASATGAYLGKKLKELASHRFIGDLRGTGMLYGIELVIDKTKKTPFPVAFHANQIYNRNALRNGLIIYPCDGTADGVSGDHILLMPPLVMTFEEADIMCDKIEQTLADFEIAVDAANLL
jgi:adenosylmethionine-8-amino-7-oxononanoate aminotransferase